MFCSLAQIQPCEKYFMEFQWYLPAPPTPPDCSIPSFPSLGSVFHGPNEGTSLNSISMLGYFGGVLPLKRFILFHTIFGEPALIFHTISCFCHLPSVWHVGSYNWDLGGFHYVNSQTQGESFVNTSFSQAYFPAVSLSHNESCWINFGQHPFVYPVEGYNHALAVFKGLEWFFQIIASCQFCSFLGDWN